MGFLDIPIVRRLLNTITNNKKTALTSTALLMSSSLGIINKETVEALSGLPIEIVVPCLGFVGLCVFIPKAWVFLFSYRLNKMKNENEVDSEELKNIEINKDILIKKRELENLKLGIA
jgi:hypothetical protein